MVMTEEFKKGATGDLADTYVMLTLLLRGGHRGQGHSWNGRLG